MKRCHGNHMICVLHQFCLLNEMMLYSVHNKGKQYCCVKIGRLSASQFVPWDHIGESRTLTDCFFFAWFIHKNMNFSALNGQFVAHFMVAREITLLLWTSCQGREMNSCHKNLNTCFTGLNGIWLNKILVAMENFEKIHCCYARRVVFATRHG